MAKAGIKPDRSEKGIDVPDDSRSQSGVRQIDDVIEDDAMYNGLGARCNPDDRAFEEGTASTETAVLDVMNWSASASHDRPGIVRAGRRRDRSAAMDFSSGTPDGNARQQMTKVAGASGGGNSSNPPSGREGQFSLVPNVASETEEDPCDPQLKEWANESGLKYVQAGGYEQAHSEFIRLRWTERRKTDIKKVQEILEKDDGALIPIVKNIFESAKDFIGEGLRNLPKDGSGVQAAIDRILAEYKATIQDRIKNIITLVNGGLTYPKLIQDDLVSLESASSEIVKLMEFSNFDEEMAARLEEEISRLRAKYKYGVQFKLETYRSIGPVPESLAPFLGYDSVHDLIIRPDRNLRSIVDFGCGDGFLLRLLQKAIEKHNENVKHFRTATSSTEGMTSEAIESLLDRTKKAYDCDGKDVIYEEQDIRRCLVGLDQSQESIKDLVESHKVKARVTDICSPWNDFSAASKIKPGSQDIVMTSHTLDRTQDPDRQLRNMVRSCAIGGQIVIVSKTGLSPVSDGREKRRDKRLVFSETDLRSDNKITLLTKLQERLGKYGVEMRAVGKHPSRIISADCNTESGPQKFSSLVIVGEKVGEVDFDK